MKEPYLHSERHFRLYERYIAAIVNTWPNLIAFTPSPPIASTETLSSRIRICKKAFFLSNHNGESWKVDFPVAKFMQICDDITVSTTAEPGKVVCGPEDLLRKKVPMGAAVAEEVTQIIPKVNLKDCTDVELVKAIIVLHHHKLLMEPSTVQTKMAIEHLAAPYDVAVERDGDTYTIL